MYSVTQDDLGRDVCILIDSDDEGPTDAPPGPIKRIKMSRSAYGIQGPYDVAECQRRPVHELIDILKAWPAVRTAGKQETVNYLRKHVSFSEWKPLWEANRPYIMKQVPGLGNGWGKAASRAYEWERQY